MGYILHQLLRRLAPTITLDPFLLLTFAEAFPLQYETLRPHPSFLLPRYFSPRRSPYVCLHPLFLSLSVVSTNLIVALTIFQFGFQLYNAPAFLSPDHLPTKRAVSPQRHLARRFVLFSSLKMLHRQHLNNSWTTVSLPLPQPHSSESTALILKS